MHLPLSDSPLPAHRGSLDLSGFAQNHRREWERGDGGEAGDRPAPNSSSLCPRCRKLTTQPPPSDLNLESNQEDDFNSIRNPEVVLVAQQTADELTKTLNTLSLGINSGRQGITRVSPSWSMWSTVYLLHVPREMLGC